MIMETGKVCPVCGAPIVVLVQGGQIVGEEQKTCHCEEGDTSVNAEREGESGVFD